MFISTRGLAPGNGERKMSHYVNEANAEACYEEACEAGYAFFAEADWDGRSHGGPGHGVALPAAGRSWALSRAQ